MSPSLSRRQFVQFSTGGLLTLALSRAFSLPGFAQEAAPVTPAVFEAMRQKWREILLGKFDSRDPIYTTKLKAIGLEAKKRWDAMDRSPERERLWEETRRGASASVSDAYGGLFAMTLAYCQPGTGFTGNEKLLADIIGGLDLMQAKFYNETIPERGNWWDWEIGSPQLLTNICVLLYDKLTPEQRAAYARSIDKFIPDPTWRTIQKGLRETGANRSDKCQNIAIRALLTDDAAKLAIARDGLSQIFNYVTVGDGYHADGSFIQHNDVPYTGTYGVVLLGGLARLFTFFAGTPWEVTHEGRKIVFDAVERTYAPFIYNGLMMDGVSGRAITRSGSRDRGHGRGAMSAILLLAEGVPPEYAAAYKARVKGWLLRGDADGFLKSVDIPSIGRARAILQDAAIPAMPEPVNHRLFHDMDHAVHRRPGWAAQISMCSSRISRYESSPKTENKRGWYVSDGMTYLYLDGDPGQYTDDFWPTVNNYRLPGTTVDTRERADNSGGGRPKTKWVGGACLRELYAAVGMELEAFDCTLRAKKSWFCVDEAIICLGAGITSTDGRTIETIIENRNLKADGKGTWLVNGQATLPGDGEASPTGVSWAHLENAGGYYFPQPVSLKAVREKREGSWDAAGSLNVAPAIVSRRYLTFWLDHGLNPAGQTYAYALLPSATPQATAQYAKNPGFEILSNTETVQAIRVRQSGLILANFWAAGSIEGIAANGPCSLVTQTRGNSFEVAVSDPSRTAATVQVTIDVPVKTTIQVDESVTVTQIAPKLILDVKTEKTRGKSHTAKFAI